MRLREGLEDPLCRVGCDAWTRVGDFEANEDGAAGARGYPRANRDFPALGELDSVADEVQQDLAESASIAEQPARHVAVNQAGDLEALRLGLSREQANDVLGDRAHVEIAHLELQFARL